MCMLRAYAHPMLVLRMALTALATPAAIHNGKHVIDINVTICKASLLTIPGLSTTTSTHTTNRMYSIHSCVACRA